MTVTEKRIAGCVVKKALHYYRHTDSTHALRARHALLHSTCRFRFTMANVLLLELDVRGFSGHGGEAVFPLFVANPRTVRLCRCGGIPPWPNISGRFPRILMSGGLVETTDRSRCPAAPLNYSQQSSTWARLDCAPRCA